MPLPPASLALVYIPAAAHLAQHSLVCLFSKFKETKKSTLRYEKHRKMKGAYFPCPSSVIGGLGPGICY